MGTLGTVLAVLGVVVMVVGAIMILIAAFRESVLWGLGSMLVPFVGLIFVCTHWVQAKKGFLLWLAGLVTWFAGVGIGIAAGA